MKKGKLYDLVPIPQQKVVVYGTEFCNNTLQFSFTRRNDQITFYRMVSQDNMNQHFLVIPCSPLKLVGSNWTITDQVRNTQELMGILRKLLAGSLFPELLPGTVIIDNLSMLYWDLQTVDNLYHTEATGSTVFDSKIEILNKLVGIIKRVAEKYRCNILVTSLDKKFEQGYQFLGYTRNTFPMSHSIQNTFPMSHSTQNTPPMGLSTQNLLSLDFIFHINNNLHQRYDSKSQKWQSIEVGN